MNYVDILKSETKHEVRDAWSNSANAFNLSPDFTFAGRMKEEFSGETITGGAGVSYFGDPMSNAWDQEKMDEFNTVNTDTGDSAVDVFGGRPEEW